MARGIKRKKLGVAEDTFDEHQEVKRPKSGYHTYANGLLNVKPKGPEVAIAKRNSESSPLLRLPREIRDKIWEEVLANWTRRKLPEFYRTVSGSKMNLGLLLTCRQVYSETALLPFEGNTFVFEDIEGVASHAQKIRKVYRGYIRHIQIVDDFWSTESEKVTDLQRISSVFPGLSSILLEFDSKYTKYFYDENTLIQCMQIQLDMVAKQFPRVFIKVLLSSHPHLAEKLVMTTQGAR